MTLRDRVTAAAAMLAGRLSTAAQLPATPGDVAQVSDMPADVAAAFGINTTPGISTDPISRKDAMLVPAFARGRDTIAGTVGKMALRASDKSTGNEVDRPFLVQPNPNTTRQYELTWTVDDLICGPVAWWWIDAWDADGWPSIGWRIAPNRVRVQSGQVYVDGVAVTNPRRLIRFDSFHDGALTTAAVTLRGALALEKAVAMYADNPAPQVVLYDKRPIDQDVKELEDTKVSALLDRWKAAGRTSPVRWVNRLVGIDKVGWSPAELDLSKQRDAAAVAVARHLNMPNRQVNAAAVGDSMTYSTTQADRTELVETTLDPYLCAIEQRLSMPDICPPGQLVDFDRDSYTLGSATDRLNNAKLFVDAGLGDVTEARRRYLRIGG